MCLWGAGVAGRLRRCLVVSIFGTAGTMLGTVVGFLSGFAHENGLIQGTLVGAISGALISMEVAESVAKIWCCDECTMASRTKHTLLVFRNLVVNRLMRASVFPTISGVVDSQPHLGRGERGDMLEPSYPVVGMRRAAVENLPVIKFTEQTKFTPWQTACPICLHDFKPVRVLGDYLNAVTNSI